MKILVVGDFHGRFPKKFEQIIKKENVDLVISLGDFAPFHYRELWFEHCYGKDVELWEVIGKKKYKELVMKDLAAAERVLKVLDKLPVPVYTVMGNIDWGSPDDVSDVDNKLERSMPNWDRRDTLAKRMEKYKNIMRFDYKALKSGDYVFVGMRGHSFPGHVQSKGFRKHKKTLETLFKKYKKENKEGKLIFVSHVVPYNTKLDKIGMKAHKKVRGKHYGSKLARRIINQFHPAMFFGGHIHETAGKQKLGNTLMINPGSAHEGKFVIVDLEGEKIKDIRFLR